MSELPATIGLLPRSDRRRALLRRVLGGLAIASTVMAAGVLTSSPRSGAESRQPLLLEGQRAASLSTAERQATPLTAPSTLVTDSELSVSRSLAVSFNGCTASIVPDDYGRQLGITGAAHCIVSGNNVLWGSGGYQAGTGQAIARSQIVVEPGADIFYIGTGQHAASEVRQQIARNLDRVELSSHAVRTPLLMSGFPLHSNAQRELTTVPLAYGGMISWTKTHIRQIGTFGNWSDEHRSCTPGSSGSGLYGQVPGLGYRIIGVLSSRAEFREVSTMPYSEAYGAELRSYFEQQIGKEIDADFLCGFSIPNE